jgi:hypothetical protein
LVTGLSVLENTDWSKFHHAYGRATDTPDHLHALLHGDENACKSALEHLWSAIIHQGTPWTATAPVALVVAGIVFDERIDRVESLRASLISFLVSVAEAPVNAGASIAELRQMAAFDLKPFVNSADDNAIYENEQAANAFFAQSILGCLDVAPALMDVMIESMAYPNARVRAVAAMGAVSLAKTEALGQHAQMIESRLWTLAETATDSDERCAHVLALGSLGSSPLKFLADPKPSVRMCAALAPALAAHPPAIDLLIETLERNAKEMDEWFINKPPQFPMRPRYAVVARLVKQVKDFDRIARSAVSVVGATAKYCVDYDWGPLLAAAFPHGDGLVQTESQRLFLTALIQKADLWDSKFGNPLEWFTKAKLPYDRKACAQMLGIRL